MKIFSILVILFFALPVCAQTYDTYHGVIEKPCPNQVPTDWNMQKIGKRWVFCTPLGHAYIKRGVYFMAVDSSHTDAGHVPMTNSSYLSTKYGATNYFNLFYARIIGWGFNSAAPGAGTFTTNSAILTANKLPFTEYYLGGQSADPFFHCMASGNCKNIWNLQTAAYDSSAFHNITDAYDPTFQTDANSAYAADFGITTFKGSPYYMGFVAGDTDYYSGFGNACTTAPNHPFAPDPSGGGCWASPGPMIVTSAPRQMVNPRNTYAVFSDPINHTKAALITYLTSEYGTIGALNTAWSCSYGSFGTAGTAVTGVTTSGSGSGPYTVTLHVHADPYSVLVLVSGSGIGGDDGHGAIQGTNVTSATVTYSSGSVSITFSGTPAAAPTINYYWGGWNTGNGLLDESGASGCIGNGDNTGTSTQIADIDNFLQVYTYTLFNTLSTAFKAQAPTKLFFGITTLGQVPTRDPARCSELAGMAQVADVVQVSTDGSQAQMDFISTCVGDKPFTNWESISAEADSQWYNCPTSCAGSPSVWPPSYDQPTQSARGTYYGSDMDHFWNRCSSTTGSCNWVGFDWWAFYDFSFFDNINLGLVTWRDNAQDGHENVTGSVTCSAPTQAFTCGGEQSGWAAYGNFLGPVTTRNAAFDTAIMGLMNSTPAAPTRLSIILADK